MQLILIISTRKRSLGRLCFYRCVCLFTGGVSVTYPLGRHHPGQTLTLGQTPPCKHPLGRTPPGRQSPGQTAPPCPVHAGIPTPLLPSACWDTVNKRAVRISLECILFLQLILQWSKKASEVEGQHAAYR